MTVSIVGTPTVESAYGTSLAAWSVPATAVDDDLVLIFTGSTFYATMAVSPSMSQIGPVTSGSGASTHANMSLFSATVADLGGAGASVTVGDGSTSNNLAAGFICLHSSTGATLDLAPADSTLFGNSAGATATGGTAPALGSVSADGIVVFASHVVDSTAQSYTAPPSGYTTQASGGRQYASVHLCTLSVTSGTSVGAAADTCATAGEWVAGQTLVYEGSAPSAIAGADSATVTEASSIAASIAIAGTDAATLADTSTDIKISDSASEITATDTSAFADVPISVSDTVTVADSSTIASSPTTSDGVAMGDASSLTVQSTSPSSSDQVSVTEASSVAASVVIASTDAGFLVDIAAIIQAALAHQSAGQVSITYSPGTVTIEVAL